MNTWILRYDRGKLSLLLDEEVFEVDSDSESRAESLSAALAEHGYAGEPVLPAISAWDCFSVELKHVDAALARDRKALSFAVERELPISSEEFVADYCKQKGRALAIATRIEPLAELLNDLSTCDVVVSSIVPESFLLAEEIVLGCDLPPKTLLLIENADSYELVRIENKLATAWRLSDSECIDLETESLLADESEFSLRSLNQTVRTSRYEFSGLEVSNRREVVTKAAGKILSGNKEPWIELCRDELGVGDRLGLVRNQIRAAAMGAVVLFVAAAAFLWSRVSYYETIADEYANKQQAVFTEILPNSRIPGAIRSRLESELKNRQGISGTSEIPPIGSALKSLSLTVDSIPEDLRLRLLQIRVEEETIDLEGQARNHSDSEQIANRLREREFTVDPPRSENLSEGGVSFSIHGSTSQEPTK
ncbi:MAG: hypothetical protein KDB27_15660 [Planctomycetales bacterium]|nr:hypothetical protein [Planctomycetales bacterium]